MAASACSAPWQARLFAPALLLLLLLVVPGPPSEVQHDPAVVADAERHPDGPLIAAVAVSPVRGLLPADLPQLDDAGSVARLADHVGVPVSRMRSDLLARRSCVGRAAAQRDC